MNSRPVVRDASTVELQHVLISDLVRGKASHCFAEPVDEVDLVVVEYVS